MTEGGLVDGARAALGLIAARHRRDVEGGRAMAAALDNTDDGLTAMSFVAEVALTLLADSTGDTFEEVVERLSSSLAMLPAPPAA